VALYARLTNFHAARLSLSELTSQSLRKTQKYFHPLQLAALFGLRTAGVTKRVITLHPPVVFLCIDTHCIISIQCHTVKVSNRFYTAVIKCQHLQISQRAVCNPRQVSAKCPFSLCCARVLVCMFADVVSTTDIIQLPFKSRPLYRTFHHR